MVNESGAALERGRQWAVKKAEHTNLTHPKQHFTLLADVAKLDLYRNWMQRHDCGLVESSIQIAVVTLVLKSKMAVITQHYFSSVGRAW